MKRELSVIRNAAVVAMLVGVPGLARADGSSMNPFTGDSYAFFNGGCNIQQRCKPAFDNAPSAFRQTNPHGLSESQLQAIAVEGPTRDFTPAVLDRDPSTWRTSHPHGLSESELQAISSEGPTYQYRIAAETAAQATSDSRPVMKASVR